MSVAMPGWQERVCRVDGIDGAGCSFYVASGAENFRVTQYGGEREFTQEMIDSIEPGDTFFDIGACIGFVAIHAARRGARVCAFEPDPQFRERLKQNVALNQLDNVHVLGWAISDTDGLAELFTDGQHGLSPTLAPSSGRGSVKTPLRSIDSAVANGELSVPQVVKLDIEGAEVRALRGMMKTLAGLQRPRKLFLEVHPPFIQQFGDDPADVETILDDCGYRLVDRRGRYEQLHEIWEAA